MTDPITQTDDRAVLRLTGPDTYDFLQGLITNDMARSTDGLIYTALLTPQGKYLADFFVTDRGEDVLIDVAAPLAPALAQRLGMYRLRAKVTIEPADIPVARGTGPAPQGAMPDPRDPATWAGAATASKPLPTTAPTGPRSGWRIASQKPESSCSPTTPIILEAGFERLHGVDFRKGCYVGQEVTARMKHKTELRKGLAPWRSRAQPRWAPKSRRTARVRARFTRRRGARHRLPALRPRRPGDAGRPRDAFPGPHLAAEKTYGLDADQARSEYSIVSVFTTIVLVLPTKGGTITFTPLSRIAGLKLSWPRSGPSPPARSPRWAGHLLRQRRVQRLVLVEFDGDGHAVLQERTPLAQDLGGQFDLLVGLGIHEDQHAVGLVEELLVLLLEPHTLDLVGGPEAFVQLGAVAQVAHFDLREGAALAGLDVVDLHRGPEPAVMLQHVAGADFVSVDLGHGSTV
jgi:tRNA-modifying protein YgfZ